MGFDSEDDFKTPQETLDEFWEDLITQVPGKITNVFPPTLYANLVTPHPKAGLTHGKNAAESYEAAADECRARVKRVVQECHRTNEKFTDPDFDIGSDANGNTLHGLMHWYRDQSENSDANSDAGQPEPGPSSTHRIDWIFEKPSFTVDNFSSSDVRQGALGDCWFIAAVATVCSNPILMEKICVERDEECGVYGFVFYRDGEWIWTVVDDNLYLNKPDFDANIGSIYDPTGAKEKKYKKNEQTGSDALYFASCADENETWLPLLEKAYAKVHGDYNAIESGLSGEAVEDLTGGVTTTILTNRILSKDRLWKELLLANKEFLFSASASSAYGNDSQTRRGLALGHAYSVLKAVEAEGPDGKSQRLVLVRNPWGARNVTGSGEWSGPWSDGSKEWTPYWLEKLDYRFGDDGIFWISYEDLLRHFWRLARTRLFEKDWTVVQRWTSVSVAWVTGYLTTKFAVEIKKGGPTVFVLSQLDERYFQGLDGKYVFDLHFLLQEPASPAGEHIVRARGAHFGTRSISAEVNLEPGMYEVVPKIVAERYKDAPDVFPVVSKLADRNPQKLRQIGMNYDIANTKGLTEFSEEERKKRELRKKEKEELKRKEREEAEKEKAEFEAWRKEKKEREEKDKAAKEKVAEDARNADEVKPESKKAEGDKDEKHERDAVPRKAETKPAEAVEGEPIPKSDAEKSTEDAGNETKVESVSAKEETSANNTHQETLVIHSLPPLDTSAPAPCHGDVPPPALDPPRAPEPRTPIEPHSPHPRDVDPTSAPPQPGPPGAPPNKQNPWNAICVLGLRVYSKDPDVSIKLVKPTDDDEAAVLDADGVTPAGATM